MDLDINDLLNAVQDITTALRLVRSLAVLLGYVRQFLDDRAGSPPARPKRPRRSQRTARPGRAKRGRAKTWKKRGRRGRR